MANLDYDTLNYEALARALNMPNLTPQAIRGAMQAAGVKTNEQAQAWVKQNATHGQGGFWSRGFGALERTKGSQELEKMGTGLYNWLTDSMRKTTPADSAQAKGGKAKAKAPTETAAQRQAAMEKAIANSPWQQMMNAVEQTFRAQEVPVVSAMGGGATVPMQNQAINQAIQLAGGGADAQGFLQGAQKTANAVNAPVQAAWNQEAAQYQANQGPISNALAAYANANEIMTAAAPQSAWLSALAQHATSDVTYYGGVPPSAISSLSPAVVNAMKQQAKYPQGVPFSQLNVSPAGTVSLARGASTTPGSPGSFTIPTAGGVAPTA